MWSPVRAMNYTVRRRSEIVSYGTFYGVVTTDAQQKTFFLIGERGHQYKQKCYLSTCVCIFKFGEAENNVIVY